MRVMSGTWIRFGQVEDEMSPEPWLLLYLGELGESPPTIPQR